MKFTTLYAAAVPFLLIVLIVLAGGSPTVGVGPRVKRQNMEQMKPWMEWGVKYGGIMATTVIMPAAQEAASIASAGREGSGEGGQS
ncbi:uncharacterized protein LOC126577137 [Anopheles aquasalis]|uniref:uncharacterized protein LOC126577137 n=1 Tax=Anopheles aquasalis TaxID=42839 RepID=UPI00215A27E0|nr:uncharacterized protein LOC126577137 [Anopheles aquasalis]